MNSTRATSDYRQLVRVETIWRDPETRTVAQAADAAVKKLSVGVSCEQVLEDLGYSLVQIERMTGGTPVPTVA